MAHNVSVPIRKDEKHENLSLKEVNIKKQHPFSLH